MILETFYKETKISDIRNTQKNSYALQPMTRISCLQNLVNLGCTKHNEINIHFYHAQKQITICIYNYNNLYNNIYNFSTGPCKRI